MMNHARRVLPPVALNKRKERESLDFLKLSSATTTAKPNVSSRSGTPPASSRAPEPALRNQLLAGYLAHEFLSKGTLLGQPWDPARAEAVPVSAAASASSRKKGKAEPETEPVEKKQRYAEVADLLKDERAHLPGIVNPTQLAKFLHL